MIKKICIVTSEIPRPFSWSGNGAHYSTLATLLAKAGHEVTIALADADSVSNREFELWDSFYRERNIELAKVPTPFESLLAFIDSARSYFVYRWLRTKEYDFVHFNDRGGLAYYSLLARRQGLAFSETEFVVNAFDTLARNKKSLDETLSSETELVIDFLESESRRMASSPSTLAPSLSPLELNAANATSANDCLIYCGRIGKNNDLIRFCDVVDSMSTNEVSRLKVYFLGALDSAPESLSYVSERAQKWKTNYNIASAADRSQALLFLRERARLAVLFPSIEGIETAVRLCEIAGIPFVEAGDCWDERGDLRASIVTGLSVGKEASSQLSARESSQESARKIWTDFHSRTRPKLLPIVSTEPFVSVCLIHKDRPAMLQEALVSLAGQTYKNFEVILVDNESVDQKFVDDIETSSSQFPLGLTVIRSGQSCPNVARNLAAKRAKGSHLLFMDDDNLAKPIELAHFAKAAMFSDADVYTCAHAKFLHLHPDAELAMWVPLGPLVSLGLRYNVFGDTNFFVKRDVFLSLGGFIEKTFYGEDWEFLSRAILSGRRLEVVPEVLYSYREHSQNLTKKLAPVSRLRLQSYSKANLPEMNAFVQLSANHANASAPRDREPKKFSIEHASLFLNPGQLQSRISQVFDVETVLGPRSITLKRAGVDPRIFVTLPHEFEGALELEVWVSAPSPQQLKLYWRGRELKDYLENHTLLESVPSELTRISFVIPDASRSGDLRFDLEGEGSVLEIHGLRINAMATKATAREGRLVRTAKDHASLMKDGEIYINGESLDWARVRTKNCRITNGPDAFEVHAENDDPVLDLSYVMQTTSHKFVAVIDSGAGPKGNFKIFWNEPYAVFSEARSVEFPLDPKGTSRTVVLNSNVGINGLRLDPMDVVGKISIKKIAIYSEEFLGQKSGEELR